MRGDVILSLQEQRELVKLLTEIKAYHTEGVEDDYGETEQERKAASFKHDDFDILHETVLDPKDPIMHGCPQCGSLTRLTRAIGLIQAARKA